MATVAIVVGLVVVVIGLGNGGSAATPAGFGNQASIVLRPGETVSTAPGATVPPTPTTTVRRRDGTPTTAPGTVPPTTVTAIGDSVMLGAAPQLQAAIDAMFGNQPVTGVDALESRQFSAGVDLIQGYKDKGLLGQDVIVQLGTNGTVDPGDFDRMMGILSDRNRVVIINANVPRPWEQQVNDTLAAGVKQYKNAVLLDWHGYAGRTPSSSTTTAST